MSYKNKELTQKVIDAENDPQLLELRKPLAIVQIRVEELLERLSTEESKERWKSVIKLFSEYRRARRTPKEDNAFFALAHEIEGAEHDIAAWDQIFDAFDLQRKLSEAELKRLKEMQQMISSEDAMSLMMTIYNVINEEVDDPKTLRRIQVRIIREIGTNFISEPGTEHSATIDIEPSGVDEDPLLDTGAEGPNYFGRLPS